MVNKLSWVRFLTKTDRIQVCIVSLESIPKEHR